MVVAPMLPSFQSFVVERPDVVRRFHGAYHPRLWVHVVEQTGCTDEALLPNLAAGRPREGRRLVGVVLGGVSRVRFVDGTTHTLVAGDATTCDGRGSFRSRAESTEHEPSLSITVDWDASYFASPRLGAPRAFRVGSPAKLRQAVDAMRAMIELAWREPARQPLVAARVSELLHLLAAEGLDVPACTARDLAVDLDDDVLEMSRSLDRALSRTVDVPMLVDVEQASGVSARTVQRTLPRVLEAWGQAPDGFRALRTRVQLWRACLVMSHPNATTERAAEVTGFSTPNALCRVFAKHELPSPGRVRERLRAAAC